MYHIYLFIFSQIKQSARYFSNIFLHSRLNQYQKVEHFDKKTIINQVIKSIAELDFNAFTTNITELNEQLLEEKQTNITIVQTSEIASLSLPTHVSRYIRCSVYSVLKPNSEVVCLSGYVCVHVCVCFITNLSRCILPQICQFSTII